VHSVYPSIGRLECQHCAWLCCVLCLGAYVLVRDALSVSQDGDSQHWALAIALPLLLPLHHHGQTTTDAEDDSCLVRVGIFPLLILVV
jgi:hypothetical protein